MTRSTSAVAERGKRRGTTVFSRVCICLLALMVFAAVSASAQSTAVPQTNAVQILGIAAASPTPSNPPTAPVGGIILYGSQISPITNQPVRHLWVGDSNFGMCRVDPDIDAGMAQLALAPGNSPFVITIESCPFKINGLSVTGGPMAFDPTTNFVYLTDEQTNSEGIFRIGYLPTGDNGQGALDFNSIFAMGGNITGSRFTGGTTGCAFPNDSAEGTATAVPLGVPNGLAIAPDGNVWVSFKKQGAIVRFNNPATADINGFGTCNDFVQLVAEETTVGGGNGIAFIGHDLWGAAEGGPFVIRNADTTCQALSQIAPQVPSCPSVVPANPAFAALTPTAIYGDQTYPYLNGNNLYFGDLTDDMWVGNVAAGGTVVEDPYEPAGAFVFNGSPSVGVNAVVADSTDPANVVLYSGDDPSLAALLAQGRWFQVAMNPPARAARPNVVTIVRASAVGNTLTVSWSPAQTGVPVTSYTVHASTGTLADQLVTPALGGSFPPNHVTITGVPNGTYAFRVTANNNQGNNGPSVASNTVTLPTVLAPGIPTNISATAGDSVAFVNFVAPPNSAAQAITGYTITSSPGGITKTVGAAATSGTVAGLTNGTTYTFTVHATNAGGKGMESTPSNPVTPAVQPKVTIALNGPLSVATTGAQATFTATLTNNTATTATGTVLTYVLSQASPDGAAVLIGQPGQGTCTPGSATATTITCTIGALAPGATVNVSFIDQLQTNPITGTVNFTANAGASTGTATLNTLTPGAPPQGGVGPTLTVTVTANSAKPTLNTGATTTHTFVATNTGSVTADQLTFTISEPTQLGITSVTAVSSAPATDPVACAAPVAGTLNNQPVNNIVCSIASLGGNLKNGNKPTTAQTITITVGIAAQTAKLQTPQNLAVSSIVVFNGIDAVSPSAGFTQTVK